MRQPHCGRVHIKLSTEVGQIVLGQRIHSSTLTPFLPPSISGPEGSWREEKEGQRTKGEEINNNNGKKIKESNPKDKGRKELFNCDT